MALLREKTHAMVSVARRRKLAERVETLGPIEHGEVFRKLKARGYGYTQNQNGTFFDVSDLPADVVNELWDFTDHCLLNQKMLNETRLAPSVTALARHEPDSKLHPPSARANPKSSSDPNPDPSAPEPVAEPAPGARSAPAPAPASSRHAVVARAGELDPEPVPPDSKEDGFDAKRSALRFQALRKKYSRPVTAKQSYVNELRRE